MRRSNWLLLAVAVCALAETGAHFYYRDRAPSEQQWGALKRTVTKLFQPNDCIAIAPSWGSPLARRALGAGLMPIEQVARGGDESCKRIIEVDFLHQRYVAAEKWPESEQHGAGPFSISVRKNPDWVPARYTFVDHLDPQSLAVSVQQASAAQECPFSEHSRQTAGGLGGDPASPVARYNCSGGFHWVGVTIIDDEHYGPRRCIWAPPSRQGSVQLRFKQVPLGRHLVGHAGGPWLMVRDGIGPPVELAATIANGPSFKAQFKDTDGWVTFEWDTQALENTEADVSLTVKGTPNLDQRFCFTLDAR